MGAGRGEVRKSLPVSTSGSSSFFLSFLSFSFDQERDYIFVIQVVEFFVRQNYGCKSRKSLSSLHVCMKWITKYDIFVERQPHDNDYCITTIYCCVVNTFIPTPYGRLQPYIFIYGTAILECYYVDSFLT
jgi:hypothetical protein